MIAPLFVLATTLASAQPRMAWNWYFGQFAGVSFAGGAAQPVSDGRLSTTEGCATMSDPVTGELLFYTDGVTVYNRLHDPMPNGSDLFGDNLTSQSVLIVPAPDRPTIYYVFNAAAVRAPTKSGRCLCLYYSIVDMRADAGYGDVVKKNELVVNDITEHLTATVDCSGKGWWIVARSRGTRHFFSFRLTTDQLMLEPIVSDAGFPTIPVRESGHMHIAPDGRKLVITSTDGNSFLYAFNNQTGKVSDGVDLFPIGSVGVHYGAAFSANSNKLYVSVANETPTSATNIYQFTLDVADPLTIPFTRFKISTLRDVFVSVPMQLAPDGRIYVGRTLRPWLSAITTPDEDTSKAEFVDTAVRLSGVCRYGLPNVPGCIYNDPSQTPGGCSIPRADIRASGTICQQSCTFFNDASSGSIDSWRWEFEGAFPAVSFERNPRNVCYPSVGSYAVRLIVSNTFGADTATIFTNVTPRPEVSIDSVREICAGEAVTLVARGATEYQWISPGIGPDPTSPSIEVRPTRSTIYTVVGKNAFGCADTAVMLVQVIDLQAGPDATICRGASVELHASGADSYLWQPSSGLSDPRSAKPLASPEQTTTYVVTLTKGACVMQDTITVFVVDSFTVSIAGPTVACVGDTITLTCSGGSTYLWSGTGVLDPTDQSCRVVVTQQRTTIAVRSTTGACTDTASVDVYARNPEPIHAGSDVRLCIGESILLRVEGAAQDYVWSPETGLSSNVGASVICTPMVSTEYVVTATDNNGCITRDTIFVMVEEPPVIDAGPDIAICRGDSARLSIAGEVDRIEWLPLEGLSNATIVNPIASPRNTTTYIVRVWKGQCITQDSITIFVSNVDLSVSMDTTVCLGQSVLLSASGAASYEWSPTTGLDNPTAATTRARPSTSTTYTVRGTDALGCVAVRSVTVTTLDTISIKLSAGSVTARAGRDNIGIPIFVEVPSHMLPMRLTNVRATLVHDASVFMPDSTDRGAIRTSVRGTKRLSYLLLDDVLILTERQKVTEVRGLVLASGIEVAKLEWEEVQWSGQQCPSVTASPGLLYVSGCNIAGRMLRTFDRARFLVKPRVESNTLDVIIEGGVPGAYSIEVFTAKGELVAGSYGSRGVEETICSVSMDRLTSGVYFVQVGVPQDNDVTPVVWYR